MYDPILESREVGVLFEDDGAAPFGPLTLRRVAGTPGLGKLLLLPLVLPLVGVLPDDSTTEEAGELLGDSTMLNVSSETMVDMESLSCGFSSSICSSSMILSTS